MYIEDEEVGLYIHIPFCKQKCLYCDFPSFSGKENLMLEYSKALAKEIGRNSNKKIKTIFIGGGTPTYLNLDALNILKKAIKGLDKDENIEFTVEMNPGTVNDEKLKILKEMGVNRLSIGLQAWQDELLKKLGRVHKLDDFLQVYNEARNLGFSNINIDIMFGLPDQTLKDWEETLQNVSMLNPEHISCYSLIIEEGTKFYKMYNDDKLNIPSEEVERNMYAYGIKFLESKGYIQYEISNFCKPEKQCRHNLIYWDLQQYVGCGSGAHSYINGFRYRNTDNIEKYIIDINNNINMKLDLHKNSAKEQMEEFMFMGLRKIKGVNCKEFKRRFNKEITEVYGDVINKYFKNNLLTIDKENISLSSKGIEISNSIMCEFILD